MSRKPLIRPPWRWIPWLDASKELRAARKKLTAASDRRFALPAGSSRAKVTTANARWAIAAGRWTESKRPAPRAHRPRQRGESVIQQTL